MNARIPCTVSDEFADTEVATTIDTDFEWHEGCPASRDDPGESTGYVVTRSRLTVTDDLRAICTDCYRVQIQHGQPVFVLINPDEWQRSEAVDIDDDELRAEIAAYLEA